MEVAWLDLPQLSSFCCLPQDSIKTLLDAPTADLVGRLLKNVSAKAREYNELKSENIRLGVELENAVRGAESKSRVLKGHVEKGLKEAADLKEKLQAEGEPNVKICATSQLKSIRRKCQGIRGEQAGNPPGLYFKLKL